MDGFLSKGPTNLRPDRDRQGGRRKARRLSTSHRDIPKRRPALLAAAVTTLLVAVVSSAAPAGAADRAYELVTPSVKGTDYGSRYLPGNGEAFPGMPSADGNRMIVATSNGPLVPSAFLLANDYALVERDPLLGWTAKPMANRTNYNSGGVGPDEVLTSASDDLAVQAWQQSYALSPEMGTWPLGVDPRYVRTWGGNWGLLGPTDPAQWIDSIKEGGTVAADGSAVVLSSYIRGVAGPDDPTQDQIAGGAAGGQSAYWASLDGQLGMPLSQVPMTPLGVCTGTGLQRTVVPGRLATGKLAAQECPAGVAGRQALISSRGSLVGLSKSAAYPSLNAISTGGRRVFFDSPDPNVAVAACATNTTGAQTSCPAQMYVGQVAQDGALTTRWISKPTIANQDASLLGRAFFEGASRDGRVVYFRTNTPLTSDDPNGQSVSPTDPRPITTGTANANSWDLYRYEFPSDSAADPGTGTLTRVSGGPNGSGDGNVSVAGIIPAGLRYLSDDGSRAYFVTAAPIPGVPAPTDGTSTVASGAVSATLTANLYLFDANKTGTERWEFIAQLPRSTTANAMPACATVNGRMGSALDASSTTGAKAATTWNCMRGTPDGRVLAFMTPGSLVAGDTDTAADIYIFDEVSDRLVPVTKPQSVTSTSSAYTCVTTGNVQCNGDLGFSGVNNQAQRSGMNVTNDGRIFFQSKRGLVPDAPNGVYSVYEWRDGALSVVTAGSAEGDAYYSGNSRDGRNVFVQTRQRLVPWVDDDDAVDVYDARVGGGFQPPPPTPEPCDPVAADAAKACQPPPAPAPFVPQSASSDSSPADERPTAPTFSVARITSAQQIKLASSGRVRLSVKTSEAGALAATATATIAKKTAKVASAKRTATGGATSFLTLKLSRAARKELSSAKKLTVKVTVTYSKVAVAQGATLKLKAAAKKQKKEKKSSIRMSTKKRNAPARKGDRS